MATAITSRPTTTPRHHDDHHHPTTAELRSRTPLHPTANHRISAKWDAQGYTRHIEKLQTAKSMVDTKGPMEVEPLKQKKKTIMLEEERVARIERDNQILVARMARILTRPGTDSQNASMKYIKPSLCDDHKRRQQQEIQKRNQVLLHRLETCTPTPSYTKSHLLTDRHRQINVLKQISAFPEKYEHEKLPVVKSTQRRAQTAADMERIQTARCVYGGCEKIRTRTR